MVELTMTFIQMAVLGVVGYIMGYTAAYLYYKDKR